MRASAVPVVALAALATVVSLAPAGCASAGQDPFDEDEEKEQVEEPFVTAHNAIRAAVAPAANPPLPPLAWDAELAGVAQAWAERCVFEHSSAPYGENLSYFSGQESTPADVVNGWASEVELYDYDSNSCAPGEQCGHYTQVVWRDTERVGCGAAVCDLFGAEGLFWVCNYDPPGNFIGERPY